MANIVQRGLASLNQTARAVRTGEGDSKAARFGKAAKKSIKKARSQLDGLSSLLGFGGVAVDAYEELDPDDHNRRRRTQALLGEEAAVFVHQDGSARDIGQTVAPEFRAQVANGLVSANSMTAGSTLVDED